MSPSNLSRRMFLRAAGSAVAAALVSACQPKVVEVEKEVTRVLKEVVKETVVVQGESKVVEKVVEVEKEVYQKGAKRPYTIVFWRHQYAPTDEFLEQVLFEEYKELEPGIDFDYFVARDAEFQEKSMPAIVAGGGPLLLEVMSAEWLIRMDKAGALATVNYEFWSGKEAFESYFVADWVRASRQILGRDEDKWIVQGPGLTPGGIYINTKLAEEDGFDWQKYQQESIAYEDIGPEFSVMTKFDDKGDITRDGFLLQHGYGASRIFGYWYGYFYNLGGQLLSGDNKQYLLNTDEGYEAMQWMYDLVFVHKASKLRPGVKESGSGLLPKHETAATPYLGYWAFGTFKSVDPEGDGNYRVLMEMKAKDKPLQIRATPNRGAAVNARFPMDEQYEGWKFLKFLSDNGNRISGAAGVDEFVRSDYPEWSELKERLDSDVYARNAQSLVPYVPSAAETLTVAKRDDGFLRAFEDMMFNDVPVKAAVDRWNDEMNEALKDL